MLGPRRIGSPHMAWTFGPDDEDSYRAARDELLDRFAVRHPDAADDASLLLDWKYGYHDGDLVTWTTGDLREFLLEWAPRKVSASPSFCRPLVISLQQFVAFLATERLLGLGSSPWRALDEQLSKLVAPFERAMGDSSRFGMAKSLFSAMGAFDDGAGDAPDEPALQRMMEAFNNLPVDARRDILGIASRPDAWEELTSDVPMPPARPRDVAALHRFVAEAPLFGGVETIRSFVGTGRKLTSTGNLNVADTKALAAMLFPEQFDRDGASNLRSANDLPLLQFMLRFARLAGATRIARGSISATAAWAKKDPLQRVEAGVLKVLDQGPIETSLGKGQWTNSVLDQLLDDSVPHVLAVLWSAGQLPAEDLVELSVEVAREELAGYRWVHTEYFPAVVSTCSTRPSIPTTLTTARRCS